MPLEIRKCDRKDFFRLWPVMLEMHADNGMYPLCSAKAEKAVWELLTTVNSWVYVVENNGIITGTMAVEVAVPWYSEARILEECWFFVRKSYRNTRTAFHLSRALAQVAATTDLPVSINIVSPAEPDRKAALLTALFRRYFVQITGKEPKVTGHYRMIGNVQKKFKRNHAAAANRPAKTAPVH